MSLPHPDGPLSVIDGGPAPDISGPGLADALDRAAETGQQIRLISADGSETGLSYADLLDAASRVLAGLRASGARPGDRITLTIDDNRDRLVAFWACVLGGFLLVADGPSAGTVAQLAGHGPDHDWFRPDLDHIALVTTTAGSTGPPKTVELSHRAILSRSLATIQDNGLDSAAVTFNWMPLDHVGGLVMFHVRDVLLACTQIHAEREWIMQDPARWLDVVHRHRVTVSWATTSGLDMIASAATGRSWDLAGLGYLLNGGEPVKARTVRRFLGTLAPFGLPSSAVRPGWGMSETAGGVVDHRLGLAGLRDRFVPVGKPHPGISVRVVDDGGAVVPEGTVGQLQVRGASVAADGWLDTADLAYVSGGLLTVTGSTADALWIDGTLHHGHEIEATLAVRLPFVDARFVAACQVGGELVICCPVPYDETAIRAVVRSEHGLVVHHVVPFPQDGFPRTRTGKPQRGRLRELLQSTIAR